MTEKLFFLSEHFILPARPEKSSRKSNHVLSYFVVMKEELHIPVNRHGWVTRGFSNISMRSAHSHEELELNLVLRGKSSYLLDKRRYFLDSDTLVWLFPGQEHILLECSNDFEMWIVVFSPHLLRQVCLSSSYQILLEGNPPGSFCKRIASAQTAELDRVLATLSGKEPDPVFMNAGLGYALTLAWSMYSATTDIPPNADLHQAVENAVYLLKKDPLIEDLETLASRAGLSPSRLSRLFKQQVGVSMVQFRNRLRIERFICIYQKGRRKNAMQAALEAGFGSYPQFHREFVRIMGCNPAAFRRQSPLPSIHTNPLR
jgi:AraC-like DNA-binding protein